MDLLEKRRYILNHLNEFTFTELEKELRAAEDKYKRIKEKYKNNKELWEDDLFNAGINMCTYRNALELKPKSEEIKLKISDGEMQYRFF